MILRNAVNAALQHAGVYAAGADAQLKREFKEGAKKWLTEFGNKYDRKTITETSWCDAIADLSTHLADGYGDYLNDARVRIGVSQKMISLYLKYRWLLGEEAKRPLYAVVDRGIMLSAKVFNPPNWTKLDDMKEYLKVVKKIEEYAQKQKSLDGAEWEANQWTDEDEAR